jgi:uroporphyrinogen decarboxylase
MTKLERFLAFANFEPVDLVPRHAGYVADMREKMRDYLGEDPLTFFNNDIGVFFQLQAPEDFQRPDFSHYFPEYEVGKDEFTIDNNGCGHKGCGFHHFNEYISPLRNATSFDELENYPFIDKSNWLDTEMKQQVEAVHATGTVAVGVIGHMYESAWQVRGYEAFLMDMLIKRDWAEYILDKFWHNNMLNAIATAKAGCDYLLTGDDVANQNAMMFQPDLWREIMKPRWAKVYAAAKEIKPDIHIWYHSDGNITDIIDDLIEIGVTILNPVQPECIDPIAIRKRYGKKLAFDGCIGTQTTFPFGTPEEMRHTVIEMGKKLDALNGGLMLSPTHVLEPEISTENVIAFYNACDELSN